MEETQTLCNTSKVLGRFKWFPPLRKVYPYMGSCLTNEADFGSFAIYAEMPAFSTIEASHFGKLF
jgi:hypothetical protein